MGKNGFGLLEIVIAGSIISGSIFSLYYLFCATTTSIWSIVTNGPALIDGLYMRTINVTAVERDASDDIVSSGGTVDPDSKKISVTMAWSGRGATSTVTISTYLS